jgi:UDP:flavonoid glycosyltransferase YjiC (YdhE family)
MSQLDPGRVRVAGFVPMGSLLRSVDLVVAAAGAGTVLSAFSAGLPMVLMSLGHVDKPDNAARAAATGAALVAEDPSEIRAALKRILNEPSFRAASLAIKQEIAAMPSPGQVLEELIRLARFGT